MSEPKDTQAWRNGFRLVASITVEAVRDLGLAERSAVTAVVACVPDSDGRTAVVSPTSTAFHTCAGTRRPSRMRSLMYQSGTV
jgi:hypothetical protein